MGGRLISLEWGNCPYARISWTLLLQLHLSTTATPPLMEIKAVANPVTASSRRGWLPLYLMSFSISLMQMLNGIHLHFSVKRVSLISLHLVTLHKSLTHFLSVILWHCLAFHGTTEWHAPGRAAAAWMAGAASSSGQTHRLAGVDPPRPTVDPPSSHCAYQLSHTSWNNWNWDKKGWNRQTCDFKCRHSTVCERLGEFQPSSAEGPACPPIAEDDLAIKSGPREGQAWEDIFSRKKVSMWWISEKWQWEWRENVKTSQHEDGTERGLLSPPPPPPPSPPRSAS